MKIHVKIDCTLAFVRQPKKAQDEGKNEYGEKNR